MAKDYESASYTSTDAGSNNGSDVANWVFDSARKAGDSAVVASDSNCYVVVFRSVGRQEYATKDVRHILFKVDESALDSEAETYEADLQAAKDAAKTAAEDALAQWKAGEATEDSFAALANELSADAGSNTNGGLYTKIYKNQMVTEFNDWCFDASRQPGDTGIVYGESLNYKGYQRHILCGRRCALLAGTGRERSAQHRHRGLAGRSAGQRRCGAGSRHEARGLMTAPSSSL